MMPSRGFSKSAPLAMIVALVLGAASGTPVRAQGGTVVQINVFEVPAGAEDATQSRWQAARDFLKSQPGYINTRLHRNLDAKGRFTFVNVAEWESPQSFRAATEAMNRAQADNKWPEGVKFTPSLFRVVAQ